MANATRNVNSSKKTRSAAKTPPSEKWVDSFITPITRAERDIESFLTKEPLATIGIALGVGLVGGLLFKKYHPASFAPSRVKKSRSSSSALSDTASLAFAGFLTRGLTGMVSRVENELASLRSGGVAEMKESLTHMITDDLTERPFETIATVVGAGFGIANLETSQVRDGAIRMAKGLAVRTLEGSPSAKLGNYKGESYEHA